MGGKCARHQCAVRRPVAARRACRRATSTASASPSRRSATRSSAPAAPTSRKAQHCRAEVWLADYGWVAMDPADVGQGHAAGNAGLDQGPAAPRSWRRCTARCSAAGKATGWRYNVAHDVALPGSSGAKLGFFMYPQAETRGERVDSLDPDTFKYKITMREITGLTGVRRSGGDRTPGSIAAVTASERVRPRPSKPPPRQASSAFIRRRRFPLVTGECTDCPTLRQALWYFRAETVAMPNAGLAGGVVHARRPGLRRRRALGEHTRPPTRRSTIRRSCGSRRPQVVRDARMSADGHALGSRSDVGGPSSRTPKIPLNRSYFDASSIAFLPGARADGARHAATAAALVVRTFWPEDFRLGGRAAAGARAARRRTRRR